MSSQGKQGSKGPYGPPGPPGQKGYPGANGQPGDDGYSGLPGHDGTSGKCYNRPGKPIGPGQYGSSGKPVRIKIDSFSYGNKMHCRVPMDLQDTKDPLDIKDKRYGCIYFTIEFNV